MYYFLKCAIKNCLIKTVKSTGNLYRLYTEEEKHWKGHKNKLNCYLQRPKKSTQVQYRIIVLQTYIKVEQKMKMYLQFF